MAMARPLVLTALALGAAAATPAGAQPSPYATSSYAVGDRYGPATAPAAAPSPYGQVPVAVSAPPLRGRVLAWPGKVEPSGPGMRAQAAPAALNAPDAPADRTYAWQGYAAPSGYAHARPPAQPYHRPVTNPAPEWTGPAAATAVQSQSGPRALAAALAGAPTDGWRPVFAGQGPAPANAPTSVAPASGPSYAPAAAFARVAPPNRAFAADRRYGYDPTQDHSVRFYSVARPFGLKPDPAPIPPQFFTATADLGGDPPGPLPVNHTTAATRAAVVGGSDTNSQ